MSKKHKEKWNKKYRERDHHNQKEPSNILVEWEPQLPEGKAFDIGCGTGRNALFLAQKGYTVDAIDFSEEALNIAQDRARKLNLKVNWILDNVNKYEFPTKEYNVIVISFFHPQQKITEIKKSLKEEGIIIMENHISTEDEINRGPSNPHFRFEPNELLNIFSNFQILFYEEGIETYEDGKKSAIVRLISRRTTEYGKKLPSLKKNEQQ